MTDEWAAFPDAADPWAAFPDAGTALPKPAPEDVRNSRGVPGGPDGPLPVRPRTVSERMGAASITAASEVLGAPVDLVSTIMGTIGLPTSEAPLLGSTSIAGMMRGLSGADERRQLQSAMPAGLREGGAPLDQRAYEGFMNTPEATELYLTRSHGAEGEGWRTLNDRFGNPTDRKIVRNDDGTETLFNPPGLDMGDVASMAGGMPDLIGAIFGGAASVPAYALGPAVGIPASAGLSATGAQIVGESVGRLFPENREAEPSIADDVLPRAAGEAGSDALIGLIMGGAGRAANAGLNRIRAPFAESASDPVATEFRGAAERLKSQGYDIAPLPSESGAGGFIPRIEGFLEKLPGSSEKMKQYRQGGDQAIARFQDDLVGGVDPNQVGRATTAELATQRKNLIIDREMSLSRADEGIASNDAALTSRQGPAMSAEGAGGQTRSGLERARQEFRDEARRLYDIARAAPGGEDPIVDMATVRSQVARIRDALPPTAAGAESPNFAPPGLRRFLTGVDQIAPRMTIDQARQMRTMITDAIDDNTLMPGVPERYLNELRQSVSRAIDGSVETAGSPELQQALTAANRHYAQNIDRFSRKGVADVYRDPASSGFVEDNRLVSRLLSGRGNPGVIRETRDLMGADSAEWAATRRNAVEQILDAGRDQIRQGRRVVNADGLVAKLNSLDDETITELFGIRSAEQLRNLAVDVSNRTKYLDAEALSPSGSANILQQLRAAAVADEEIARTFRSSVIAPFLRGESGAAAKMAPEELVPWLYRRARPEEARAVMERLDPAMRRDVERGVVADLVENAISRGSGDMSAVRRLVSGEANPADSQGIAEMLGAGKDSASRQQADRVGALLSPENRQALRDLALITAKRQERDGTTSAIGGLAAGAAVTNILSRPASALQAAAVSRGLAELITQPSVRKWLTNTRRAQMDPVTQSQAVAFSPTITDFVGGAMSENQDFQTAIQWIREGVSEADRGIRGFGRQPSR